MAFFRMKTLWFINISMFTLEKVLRKTLALKARQKKKAQVSNKMFMKK